MNKRLIIYLYRCIINRVGILWTSPGLGLINKNRCSWCVWLTPVHSNANWRMVGRCKIPQRQQIKDGFLHSFFIYAMMGLPKGCCQIWTHKATYVFPWPIFVVIFSKASGLANRSSTCREKTKAVVNLWSFHLNKHHSPFCGIQTISKAPRTAFCRIKLCTKRQANIESRFLYSWEFSLQLEIGADLRCQKIPHEVLMIVGLCQTLEW